MTQEIFLKIFKKSKLNIKDFATKLGVSPDSVSRWKSGKQEPSFVNQKRIRVIFRDEVNAIKNV